MIGLTTDPAIIGIPVDLVLFALTLVGVAVFHHQTMCIALAGLVTVTIYKMVFTGFKTGDGVMGFVARGDLFERPRMQKLRGELIAAVDQLLRRAKAVGAIRRDVVAEDIGFLINAVGHAGLRLEHTAPGAWRRYVEIVLAGLAPQGRRKLAHKPPTSQQLHDSKRSR